MGTRYNRLIEAVLTSTHNLCFRAKIRKNEYPGKPQFYYIKVGCKGSKLHGHASMMRHNIAFVQMYNVACPRCQSPLSKIDNVLCLNN